MSSVYLIQKAGRFLLHQFLMGLVCAFVYGSTAMTCAITLMH
jgi:hypothetical protein